ncbi:MAG: twin transmembrane helix small protein [bacterium]
MGIKFLVLVLFLTVLGSLVSAMFFLMKGNTADSSKTVKALTFRIGLSLAAFIILMVGYFLGYIQPHTPFPQ